MNGYNQSFGKGPVDAYSSVVLLLAIHAIVLEIEVGSSRRDLLRARTAVFCEVSQRPNPVERSGGEEDHILGDVGGMVRDSFEIRGNEQHVEPCRQPGQG